MNKHRINTIDTLHGRMGISWDDTMTLLRISQTLSTWGERECNGEVQRDEKTNIPYVYDTNTGRKRYRAIDRETGALKRAKAIAGKYGLTAYYQTDPRGVSLYLVRPGDVPEGEKIESYYSRGIAVANA